MQEAIEVEPGHQKLPVHRCCPGNVSSLMSFLLHSEKLAICPIHPPGIFLDLSFQFLCNENTARMVCEIYLQSVMFCFWTCRTGGFCYLLMPAIRPVMKLCYIFWEVDKQNFHYNPIYIYLFILLCLPFYSSQVRMYHHTYTIAHGHKISTFNLGECRSNRNKIDLYSVFRREFSTVRFCTVCPGQDTFSSKKCDVSHCLPHSESTEDILVHFDLTFKVVNISVLNDPHFLWFLRFYCTYFCLHGQLWVIVSELLKPMFMEKITWSKPCLCFSFKISSNVDWIYTAFTLGKASVTLCISCLH